MNHQVSLDDKYLLSDGRVFMSGLQALVRLPMVQARLDKEAGLNTGGFISGYRGSPLGGYDQALERAEKLLNPLDVKFVPGVNEDLAATAVWGSQQLHLSPDSEKDGVFGIWYGKGPGVDRCGDVFKHANAAGSSQHGGVLCIAGDDHAAKSSTMPHQSEHAFMSALMPVLYPSCVHDYVRFGLLGIAMSRYSGCWVGMKVISDTVESTAAVDLSSERLAIKYPENFELSPDGMNLRWPDDRYQQDHRLQNYKGYAAIAFARANRIDEVKVDSPKARFGIIASGKSYEIVREALKGLGIDDKVAAEIGIRVYKVGMPWPLEPEGVREFSVGLEEILVVEERREIIENQIKQQLFNWRPDVRPRIIGKFDDKDQPVLPLDMELTVGRVARAIARRISTFFDNDYIKQRLAYYENRHQKKLDHQPPVARTPWFCSGCPHNSSTKVPDGSRAMAGIGCHYMVQWMDRNTETYSHMGGEGVTWVGASPFTKEKHMFVNLGDGTYYHSGLLAIRQAVAAKINITYKILYNDAVAMTGGQSVDGPISVPQIIQQVASEGVAKIRLLTEDKSRYDGVSLAAGVIPEDRKAVNRVMKELREEEGCTILIYDQTCAAEKRRRRKRGMIPDPDQRAFINDAVCEGCGDCSIQSNCISVEPKETLLGRKRQINQSACNKDFSCLDGFCPSFVTVEGAVLKKHVPPSVGHHFENLPEPTIPALTEPFNIGVTGVGGTGVITIGAVLGMAAHIDGKACTILDSTGLAQKGGAVMSQLRLGDTPDDLHLPSIPVGQADLLLACDNVVATSAAALDVASTERTEAVVNRHLTPVANFVRDRDYDFKAQAVEEGIASMVRENGFHEVDATALAEAVVGDAIGTNMLMLGAAWQKGLVPVSREAIEQAITLNGVAVEMNMKAFNLGRAVMADSSVAKDILASAHRADTITPPKQSLDELIAHREDLLVTYGGKRLAKKYRQLIEGLRNIDKGLGNNEALTRQAAAAYYRVLAIKDEYEVARLYTDPAFEQSLKDQFESWKGLQFHLAPPLLSKNDPNTGRPEKKTYGPWMMKAFGYLAKMRSLRGTPLDVFGWHDERKRERNLIARFEKDMARLQGAVTADNYPEAMAIIAAWQEIRGYGPVKMAAIDAFEKGDSDRWKAFENPQRDQKLAAE